ncbi:MAG: hypothetical protein D6738_03350 [Acidobacteria bacterium]|nr:MAG: hypothetical protein D6738_03350 [Acidobacteriota bacterium]
MHQSTPCRSRPHATESLPSDRAKNRACLRPLLLLCCSLLLLRIMVALWLVPAWERTTNVSQFPDLYPQLAAGLLADHTLSFAGVSQTPTIVRGPGFPAYLALGLLILSKPTWLRVWSVLPGILLAVGLGQALCRRFGRMVGISAAAIVGGHPLAVVVSARVMSDEFVAFASAAAIGVLFTARRWEPSRLTLSVLLFNVAILSRATAVLALLATAIAAFRFDKDRTPTQRALFTSLLVLFALIGPAFWSIRSSRLAGTPVFVHSLAYYNIWMGIAHDRAGIGRSWQETWRAERAILGRLAPDIMGADGTRGYATLSPLDTATLERRLAAALARDLKRHPAQHLLRGARGLLRFWWQAQTQGRTRQYFLAQAPLLVLTLVGLCTYFCRRQQHAAHPLLDAFALWLLATNIAYAWTLPMARMSVQVLPATATFCALAGHHLLAGVSSAWRKRQPH